MKSLKFIVVIMVTIFLSNIGCSVSAEKKDWIDKTYNFSAVKNVFICKIDDSVIPALDDKLDEQIQLIGRKFENKIKRPILAEDSENLADIKVISQIIEWEKESKYIPEEIYYEGWETKTTRDRDGKEKRERHYKKSRVWFFGAHERRIPAHYVYDSVLKVSFEVYDIKSGNLVMKRDDKRRRVGSSEHLNMFERICKSFFQDLNKEIKLSRR